MEFNPVVMFRKLGENELKKQLEIMDIKELRKMVRTWVPDMNGTMYRTKKKERVINYILERSHNLSRLGQCFRTLDIRENE
jgi:hypothetical protein